MKTEIIDVAEITVTFKDRVFDNKLMPPVCRNDDQLALTKSAYKNMQVGNMYTYKNLIWLKELGVFSSYLTQTTDHIVGDHSLSFLN